MADEKSRVPRTTVVYDSLRDGLLPDADRESATSLPPGCFRRPEILLHPQIPAPLAGVNPRTIMGDEWWNVQRQAAYAKNKFHCWACGVHKSQAKKHRWLEGHEAYAFDDTLCRLTLIEIVALCHYCHNYIHDGRMRMMVDRGEMAHAFRNAVLAHGLAVTGQPKPVVTEADVTRLAATWSKWHLFLDGKQWGPSTADPAAWRAGLWRLWKPGNPPVATDDWNGWYAPEELDPAPAG